MPPSSKDKSPGENHGAWGLDARLASPLNLPEETGYSGKIRTLLSRKDVSDFLAISPKGGEMRAGLQGGEIDREDCCSLLGKSISPAATAILAVLAREDPFPQVRSAALRYLINPKFTHKDNPASAKAVEEAISEDQDLSVVTDGIDALVRAKSAGSSRILRDSLARDIDPGKDAGHLYRRANFAAAYVDGLTGLGDRESVPFFTQILKDTRHASYVRVRAAVGLTKLDPDSVPLVKEIGTADERLKPLASFLINELGVKAGEFKYDLYGR
jgi:hypothetical protein